MCGRKTAPCKGFYVPYLLNNACILAQKIKKGFFEQEYKQFEQFVNEVNRALNELDQQQQQPSREQEQVKKSGMDK